MNLHQYNEAHLLQFKISEKRQGINKVNSLLEKPEGLICEVGNKHVNRRSPVSWFLRDTSKIEELLNADKELLQKELEELLLEFEQLK